MPKTTDPRPARTEVQLTWGPGVRERRTEAGLSQSELARAVGVSQTRISRVELGTAVPSDRVRVRIARALDCDPHELFPYREESA